MRTMDLSYRLNSQHIPVTDGALGYEISAEVFTFDNLYTVPQGGYRKSGNTYRSDSLVWGDTEPTEGTVILTEEKAPPYGKKFTVKARMGQTVRSVKLRFDGLPLGTLVNLTSEDKEITEEGLVETYHNGWRGLTTPLIVFRLKNGKHLFLRCLDDDVNVKYFFFKRTGEDAMRVDIVQEQNATAFTREYAAPPVECGVADEIEDIYRIQSDYIAQTFGVREWEESPIVPAWMRDVSLVVTMHMETYTGHIFHTYEQAARDVERLSKRLDGKRILVYLAGWEGRYYYKYGDYTPDERLGGAEKLKEAVARMHACGAKVLAMYGINMANADLPEVAPLVEDSCVVTASGRKLICGGSVDWDGSHSYDVNGKLTNFNIADKGWQDHLFRQIEAATKEYDFDGAFLDILAYCDNDMRAHPYTGIKQFCERLRAIKPDFLLSGEGYYDGLSAVIPLFQSGHTSGEMHYHDRSSPLLFTRFSREFAHLCLGDPAHGSTGVHELGTNPEKKAPLRKGIIPTLSLVDDTLDAAPEQVEEIVQQAEEYIRRYL